jgi:hypothetical protein
VSEKQLLNIRPAKAEDLGPNSVSPFLRLIDGKELVARS